MKYLLKQNKEDKGILCNKVIIDGYKYYLYYNTEPKKIGQYYITKDNQVDIVKTGKELGKPILCTNNPNIDIPKVVREVDIIADSYYPKYSHTTDLTAYQSLKRCGFEEGYNTSQEIYPNSDKDMIEFAEWKGKEKFEWNIRYNNWTSQLIEYSGCLYTTKELFQLWKEQQPKIVYYNE